jgi:hypothetical protein
VAVIVPLDAQRTTTVPSEEVLKKVADQVTALITEVEASGGRAASDAQFWFDVQFWFLVLGAVFFLIWHVIGMVLRSG